MQKRHYEIVILVNPNHSGDVPAMIDRYKSIVTKKGGKVHRLENWGKRTLAYPINKLKRAHYILMNVECLKETLDAITDTFKHNEAILRNLVLQQNSAITEPSPILVMMEKEAAEKNAVSHSSSTTTSTKA